MQIKKDDIRQDIINAASREFATKGYLKSSLRLIAKKANTTLGNIYNYFPSKEALLDEIIGTVPEKIREMIHNHNDENLIYEVTGVHSFDILKEDINLYVQKLAPLLFPIELLLSEPFIILVEGCEGTRYEKYKDTLIEEFSAHIGEHLNLPQNHQITKIFISGSLTAIMMIAKSKKSMEDKIEDFYTYLLTLTYGFPMPPTN